MPISKAVLLLSVIGELYCRAKERATFFVAATTAKATGFLAG
jgi:hypothetical protein